MSDKTSLSCQNCNASFIVDVFSLGHKENDGLKCDCCNEWILPIEKRTKSYSIIGVTRHGNLKLKRGDLANYIGKKLLFSRGNENFIGIVNGQSEAVFATASEPIHPWLVISGETAYHLDPEDRWNICACNNA